MGQRKLEVKCLCKSFGDNTVLQKIDFYVDVSEFVAVMGQSGCGKSTLLYCVSGKFTLTDAKCLAYPIKKWRNCGCSTWDLSFRRRTSLKIFQLQITLYFRHFSLEGGTALKSEGKRNR